MGIWGQYPRRKRSGAADFEWYEADTFRDAVKQKLALEDGNADSPNKPMIDMDAQLETFEAAKEMLGTHK